MSKIIIAHLTSVDPVMGGVIKATGEYALEANLEGTPFLALARASARKGVPSMFASMAYAPVASITPPITGSTDVRCAMMILLMSYFWQAGQ